MYKTIDLFAGAGGLSYGFEMTGDFQIVAAAEINKNARTTYINNHRNGADIEMISDVRGYDFAELSRRVGNVDIIIGGPPCQGFSNANRQKNHIISMNNSLVKEYFRAVEEIKPKAFVMENVSMLASDTHRFYDSYDDHDKMVSLGLVMKDEELVLADGRYDGISLLEVFEKHEETDYEISNDLFQLLNVLYKNRRSKEKLSKYIKAHKKELLKQIGAYKNSDMHQYDVFDDVEKVIENEETDCFGELGKFLKFQKSIRLKEELDDNRIIYKLKYVNTDSQKLVAEVKSYSVFEYVNKILGNAYKKKCKVMNSLWFGVPQERKRFILIGIRKDVSDKDIELPEENEDNVISVGEAILDLMDYPAVDDLKDYEIIGYNDRTDISDYAKMMRAGSLGVSNHIIPQTRDMAKHRFEMLEEGENFHKLSSELKANYADPGRTQNSIYLRLDSSRPSGTVINVRKSMWIHPRLNRAISVREAARLQSFPDSFIFSGTKDSQYQQVGNAVPPLMAKGIAQALLKSI